MSTSAGQAKLAPTWKQEVNNRLAAHKSRKNSFPEELKTPAEAKSGASSVAAKAAARVAARYAKAPSYSEMLAAEARAAVRAAEAAARAALEAQAAAESVLAGLEAGSAAEQTWESEAFQSEAADMAAERFAEPAWQAAAEPARPAAASTNHVLNHSATPAASQTPERQSYGIRWEADLPVRAAKPAAIRATRGQIIPELPAEDWREPALPALEWPGASRRDEFIEVVEPAQPLHANLIEFPRELIATRKIRPRLAGASSAACDATGQLSIFEVDPDSVSTLPSAAEPLVEAAAAWQGPDWSAIRLGEQAAPEAETEAEMAADVPVLQPASMVLRLLAAVVDSSLMTAVFLGVALTALNHARVLPAIKTMEVGAAVALLAVCVAYQLVFCALGVATPGMKWAGISLCTFDDQIPTRAQRSRRLGAMILSLLPVGLGVAWAVFDDEHLSWHDRLTGTYLRRT